MPKTDRDGVPTRTGPRQSTTPTPPMGRDPSQNPAAVHPPGQRVSALRPPYSEGSVSVAENGLRGCIYDTNSAQVRQELYQQPKPWDPRTSAMEAFDAMITKNVLAAATRLEDGNPGADFRPWICVNSGVPRSGKTKLLQLSCNRFVSADSDKLFPGETRLARHAIYITMNGRGVDHSLDETDHSHIRLYHRILFAIRENRDQQWESFLTDVKASKFGVMNAPNVVQQIRKQLPKAHVLIAADELRMLAPKTAGAPPHVTVEQCQKGLSGLNELVRTAWKPGDPQIFVVASALSVVDLKTFATDSSTPFTFQPLEPVEPKVIRAIFEKAGIDPDARRGDSSMAKDVLLYSTEMSILMALHDGSSLNDVMNYLNRRDPTSHYIRGVYGKEGLIDRSHVRTLFELLVSLFVPQLPEPNASFHERLHPALDAMCYDVCRVIRRGGIDSVLMRPDVMTMLCRTFLTVPEALRTPAQTAFVDAVLEFAQALTATVAYPNAGAGLFFVKVVREFGSKEGRNVVLQRLAELLRKDARLSCLADKFATVLVTPESNDHEFAAAVKAVAVYPDDLKLLRQRIEEAWTSCSPERVPTAKPPAEDLPLNTLLSQLDRVGAAAKAGKAFESLIKSLFRCLLLSGEMLRVRHLLKLSAESKWEDKLLSPANGGCPDVPGITAFPRAYDAFFDRDEEFDVQVLDLIRPREDGTEVFPCVFQPTDPFNLLLDVAVLAKTTEQKKVCFALQCKEYSVHSDSSFPAEVTKWRNRQFSPEHPQTASCMAQFEEEVDILWVMVTVNPPPPGLQLGKNEALLSLDAARSWCPSLQFARSASAVWSPERM